MSTDQRNQGKNRSHKERLRTDFERTKLDNVPGLSVEDRKFIEIMDASMEKNKSGSWVAPLERKPEMKERYFGFMKKLFDNQHAEPVPVGELDSPKPRWYLPHFGVYHSQKPHKIRVVFDSAAEVDGVSLNKLLLSGPDLTNSLLGELLRFRQNVTAFMADVEQMFHSFTVKEEYRDFLRFLWYKDNHPDGAVMEY